MEKTLVWLRRDLRLHDHAALSYATNNSAQTFLVFIFDSEILSKLKAPNDHRVEFIFDTVMDLKKKLKDQLYILYGNPTEIIPDLAKKLKVNAVVSNRDYESYALKRDANVKKELQEIEFIQFKDHVLFEANEVQTGSGEFYKVFTPYKNAWLKKIESDLNCLGEKSAKLSKIHYEEIKGLTFVNNLADIGFKEADELKRIPVSPKKYLDQFFKHIQDYSVDRDFPGLEGTSRLSPYLRFGQLSIRELLRKAWVIDSAGAQTWISELCWRDFYSGILQTYPYIEKHAYLKKYENIPWENDKKKFKAWCEGLTGVPIVDAAMRELNQTGHMHNRCRMITASYLTKTLLIDWRWGEKYFAEKLMDFDLASNNGGWQWSASTGCDASPYFRVFNPYRQSERFDPEAEYILKYVPELKDRELKFIHDPTKMKEKDLFTSDYPDPIADYSFNREKIISLFKHA